MMNNKLGICCILVVALCLGNFHSVFAAGKSTDKEEQRNPLGCRNIGHGYDLNTLTILPAEAGSRHSLYFVYNKSEKPVNLYQMHKDDSSRTMFLNSKINPHQWGVLSTDERKLRYICAVDDPKMPHDKVVNCRQTVRVCEYARVRYGVNNRGNYWLVRSNSRGGAVASVINYGIIPQ